MIKQWFFLENTQRPYPWGSTDGIPTVMGFENPNLRPIAELWMGAHPSAPSTIIDGNLRRPLDSVINKEPELYLGKACISNFGEHLPYLLKILSAAHPLSIQVHPGEGQAQKGFKKENNQGIPVDDPTRSYKDPFHKPEIIMALTNFSAMCGFRHIDATVELFRQLGCKELFPVVEELEKTQDYKKFLSMLFILSEQTKDTIFDLLEKKLFNYQPNKDNTQLDPFTVVEQLMREYPRDMGILAPLYLNSILLKPGEAIYLPDGIMHAYLKGTGIELMGNSDNVLRCGLTKKHIDIPELLSILNPEPYMPEIILPISEGSIPFYKTPAKEFELSIIQPKDIPITVTISTPSILVCLTPTLRITGASGAYTEIKQGATLFFPANAGSITFSGDGSGYMACVPVENLLKQ